MAKHDVENGPALNPQQRVLSRRAFLEASLTGAVVAGVAGIAADAARAQMRRGGTTAKSVARYQNTPNRRRRCSGCVHFLRPNRCAIVAGAISPNGWCRFYERRAARRSGNGGY